MNHSQYETLQRSCGFVDQSELGKLALLGNDAKTFLNGQVTNDVEHLQPGEGCYAAFLTPKGKMLGDLRVIHSEHELLLLVERVALQALFDRIRLTKVGYDVTLEKRTLQMGCISLLGPTSMEILHKLATQTPKVDFPSNAKEHTSRVFHVADTEILAVISQFGVDLLYPTESTLRIKEALNTHRVTEVDPSVAEVLRVESGRPRYGIDLDESVIPQEAGLNSRAVSFQKGCYVGQETVARLFYKGKPNRHLRRLTLTDKADPGSELFQPETERCVGKLGSVVYSPKQGWIALALVRREVPEGAQLVVEKTPESTVLATVQPLPEEKSALQQ